MWSAWWLLLLGIFLTNTYNLRNMQPRLKRILLSWKLTFHGDLIKNTYYPTRKSEIKKKFPREKCLFGETHLKERNKTKKFWSHILLSYVLIAMIYTKWFAKIFFSCFFLSSGSHQIDTFPLEIFFFRLSSGIVCILY